MYVILHTKAFVGNDSFKAPSVWIVACIAKVWFWPILPHKQTSNLEGSVGLFYELYESLICLFSMDSSKVSIGFKSGDWPGYSSSFVFSETNWEFPWLCLGSLFCWNVHPCFIFIILVGTEPANINFHRQGAGLLFNYW